MNNNNSYSYSNFISFTPRCRMFNSSQVSKLFIVRNGQVGPCGVANAEVEVESGTGTTSGVWSGVVVPQMSR